MYPEILRPGNAYPAPLTILPAWISLFVYARYRIDKARHAEIREELKRRAGGPSS